MIEQWIQEPEWKRLQEIIPISCVDVLLLRYAAKRRLNAVGLILRDTPHQGQRWCLVGGRILYGESFGDAVRRHLIDTLGEDIHFQIKHDEQPIYMAQYRPLAGEGFLVDPRRHAVAATYSLEISGLPRAQNEALSFEWFDLNELPSRDSFGFDQDRVVAACLALLNESYTLKGAAAPIDQSREAHHSPEAGHSES
jgi:ADP-ribose pyrophosphatase YjhB (NUDIX family)